MLITVKNSAPFQILTSAMVIGPSQTGYQLEVAADGRNFSPLFSVGPNVTRQATNLSSGAYYRLNGNVGDVVVNWRTTCVTEGGAAGNELTPVTEFPLNADPGDVVALVSGDTMGVYQYDGENWNEVGADVDLSAYWTSAQTQSAITAVEDHLFDVEQVTASALTELHEGLLEVSARTVDLSGYYTSAQTDSAIAAAVAPYYTSAQTDSAIENALEDYWTSADAKNYVDDELTGYTPTSGFSTINGSAITNGGNIVIQGGGGGGSTEEIELPIAAAVNDIKDNIEARLNQKYYTRQEVNDIAARKTEPGQVNVQIQDYVDPAITEINDNIEDKELPVSAALNDLNQKISEISGGSGGDMSAYWTSAQTEEAISAATAGKADAANIAANTGNYIFPKWNNQGIISGTSQQVFKSYLLVNDEGTGAYFFMNSSKYETQNRALKLYTPLSAGTAGDILVSAGANQAPVWTTDNKVSSTSVSTIWRGTQAEYDAITTKDPNTFYIIVNN